MDHRISTVDTIARRGGRRVWPVAWRASVARGSLGAIVPALAQRQNDLIRRLAEWKPIADLVLVIRLAPYVQDLDDAVRCDPMAWSGEIPTCTVALATVATAIAETQGSNPSWRHLIERDGPP